MLLVLKGNGACWFNNSAYSVKSILKYFEEIIQKYTYSKQNRQNHLLCSMLSKPSLLNLVVEYPYIQQNSSSTLPPTLKINPYPQE